MAEEIFDRTYRDGREPLHRGIDRALEVIRCSLVKTYRLQHAIQFDAPWKRLSKDIGCA